MASSGPPLDKYDLEGLLRRNQELDEREQEILETTKRQVNNSLWISAIGVIGAVVTAGFGFANGWIARPVEPKACLQVRLESYDELLAQGSISDEDHASLHADALLDEANGEACGVEE